MWIPGQSATGNWLPLRMGEIFSARPYLIYRESLVMTIKKRPSDEGSAIHVMLALRPSSRQVVVANEQLDGPDMIRELL